MARNGVYHTTGDPKLLLQLLEQAHQHYAAGNIERAKIGYHSILKIDKNFPDANNSLGIIEIEALKFDLAEKWFGRAINAEPTRPTFHNNRGLALFELGRDLDAVECFKAALDNDPKFVPAMVNLGKGYNAQEKYKLAIEILENALELKPDFLNAYSEIANAYGELGNLEAAISTLNQAMEVSPNDSRLFLKKANLYTTFGKLKEAEEIFRQILRAYPNDGGIYAAIAKMKKFQTYDDDIRNMERIYKSLPDTSYESTFNKSEEASDEKPKVTLALALAKAFEAINNFEQAFNYYKEGNRLRRKYYSYNEPAEFDDFDTRRETFAPAMISKFQGHGFADSTPIFILGMPRSGTTLLEQVLHSHKDVFGAGELQFVSDLAREHFKDIKTFRHEVNVGKITDQSFANFGAAYIEKIRSLNTESPYITDKMPHNFLHVGLIKLALPNAKVIHSYRNPIDNAFAIFKQSFGNESHRYGYDLVELGRYHNKYRELMAHWDAIFPGEIFECRYEDMVADLEGQTRRVLDFCGLDWDPNTLNFHQAERAIRTASVTQVRQPIYKSSVEKWRKYETQLQPLIRALEKGLPF